MATLLARTKLKRYLPGMEAKPAYLGHARIENRCGLIVDACLTQDNGHTEAPATLAMIAKGADVPLAIMLGADKRYDAVQAVS